MRAFLLCWVVLWLGWIAPDTVHCASAPLRIPLHAVRSHHAYDHVQGKSFLLDGGIIRSAQFYATVLIGGQQFNVQIDTGSSLLAVPDVACSTCALAPGDHKYRLNQSSTFVPFPCNTGKCDAIYSRHRRSSQCCSSPTMANMCQFGVNFGDSSHIRGALGYDMLSLGPVASTSPMVFGRISESRGSFAGGFVDGILGVAYDSLSGGVPTAFDRLTADHKTDNIFGMCLTEQGGSVDLGAIDDLKFTGDMRYTPVREQKWFVVRLNSVHWAVVHHRNNSTPSDPAHNATLRRSLLRAASAWHEHFFASPLASVQRAAQNTGKHFAKWAGFGSSHRDEPHKKGHHRGNADGKKRSTGQRLKHLMKTAPRTFLSSITRIVGSITSPFDYGYPHTSTVSDTARSHSTDSSVHGQPAHEAPVSATTGSTQTTTEDSEDSEVSGVMPTTRRRLPPIPQRHPVRDTTPLLSVREYRTLVDSGTTFLTLPAAVGMRLFSSLYLLYPPLPMLKYFFFDPENAGLPCLPAHMTLLEEHQALYPDLVFSFPQVARRTQGVEVTEVGNFTVRLQPQHYFFKADVQHCIGIQFNGTSNLTVLGDSFLESQYTVFDKVNDRVGFAEVHPVNCVDPPATEESVGSSPDRSSSSMRLVTVFSVGAGVLVLLAGVVTVWRWAASRRSAASSSPHAAGLGGQGSSGSQGPLPLGMTLAGGASSGATRAGPASSSLLRGSGNKYSYSKVKGDEDDMDDEIMSEPLVHRSEESILELEELHAARAARVAATVAVEQGHSDRKNVLASTLALADFSAGLHLIAVASDESTGLNPSPSPPPLAGAGDARTRERRSSPRDAHEEAQPIRYTAVPTDADADDEDEEHLEEHGLEHRQGADSGDGNDSVHANSSSSSSSSSGDNSPASTPHHPRSLSPLLAALPARAHDRQGRRGPDRPTRTPSSGSSSGSARGRKTKRRHRRAASSLLSPMSSQLVERNQRTRRSWRARAQAHTRGAVREDRAHSPRRRSAHIEPSPASFRQAAVRQQRSTLQRSTLLAFLAGGWNSLVGALDGSGQGARDSDSDSGGHNERPDDAAAQLELELADEDSTLLTN